MLKAILIDPATGKALGVLDDVFGHPTIETVDHYQVNTKFKSKTRVGAGTSTITSPTPGGAILLTDLIISTDKEANPNSQLTVFFDDETRTINIFDGFPSDAPINLAIGLHGAWTGWKNAALKMTTVLAVKATVVAGYIKIPNGLEYAAWDALR